MKFIIFFFQKFQEKSQSFQIHQDTSSPKFSSRNIFLMPKSFCQSLIMALFTGFSEIQKRFRGAGSDRQRRFSPAIIVNLTSAALAACSLLPPPYLRAAKSLGWTRASVPSRPVSSGELSDAAAFRLGHQKSPARFAANQHRPSHREAPRGHPLLWSHRRTVVVAWNR